MASLKHADDRRTTNEKPSEDTSVTYSDSLSIVLTLWLLRLILSLNLWGGFVDAKWARSQETAVRVRVRLAEHGRAREDFTPLACGITASAGKPQKLHSTPVSKIYSRRRYCTPLALH
jgi:hypothetical protein